MSTTPAIAPRPTSKTLAKYSAEEIRMMIATLRAHLMTGASDIKCAEEMTLDVATYNALKREMYQADKLDMSGKSQEDIFIDYKLRQEGCIGDLEKIISDFKSTKQYNAAVGAIKAKSDIIDKIVSRGQEFGVMEKVPEKKQIIAGVLVASMTNDELRAQVAKEVTGMDKILKKYGTEDILGKPMTAAEAGLLPEAKAAASSASSPPVFSAKLKPKMAVGGISKVAGGKARAEAAKAEKPAET